jgi:glycosyltransferase involved in cell wall biosynthesis
MYTILYPINKLVIGGAEQQLLELVRGLDKDVFHPIVAPLYPGGGLEPEFRAIPGLEIVDLNRRGKYDPSPLWNVTRMLRRRRVDIVQPFLSPATFFGLLPALTRESATTIVTERCGVRQSRGIGYKTYRTIEDWFSHLADAIVPNSVAGEQMLVDRGLPRSKIRVIYNGINLERLTVDGQAAAAHRATLASDGDVFIAGMLASLTPAKGHAMRRRSSGMPRAPPNSLLSWWKADAAARNAGK